MDELTKKAIESMDFINPDDLYFGLKSGFFDLPTPKSCNSSEHNPPAYISIPQGKGYRHVCPSCGKVQIIIPPQATL